MQSLTDVENGDSKMERCIVKDCYISSNDDELMVYMSMVDATTQAYYQRLSACIYTYVPEVVKVDGSQIYMKSIQGTNLMSYLNNLSISITEALANNSECDIRQIIDAKAKMSHILQRCESAFSILKGDGICHYDKNLAHYLVDSDMNVWLMDFEYTILSTKEEIHSKRLEEWRELIKPYTHIIDMPISMRSYVY